MENLIYIKEKLAKLKKANGSHSPSIQAILREIPEIRIDIDACFLSNPYATDLFLNYLNNDLIITGKLRDVLEFYPPQIKDVRKNIATATKVLEDKIFVGNGATEIIQAVLQSFVKESICVILPTFSSYYEFVNKSTNVHYYTLSKENKFKLDIDDYIGFIKKNNIKNVVLINPNNPNGLYLSLNEINYIVQQLKHLDNIIIDESFIHFAYEDAELFQINSGEMISQFPNLVFIKSMSKDFGIAGIRAGYAIMNDKKVDTLLSKGYLWNVSGLADYFFKVYGSINFQKEYNVVRKKYIMNTTMFFSELEKLSNFIYYPSKANFALIEIKNETSSLDFTLNMLVNKNVYVRDCSDKLGLQGEFIRIASRKFEDNLIIIDALKTV